MSSLPDWVLKYKQKGVYARKTKHGYALYKGHSERVPGKPYPVFRCDEYLGIVTEQHGLTPSRPPVKPGIRVYRYGFARVVEGSCAILRKNPQRLGLDAQMLFVRAALGIEGRETPQGFESSYLSVMFPSVDMHTSLGEQQKNALATMRVQMTSKLHDRFADDHDELLELSSDLYAVHVNGTWHLSHIPERLTYLAANHALSLEWEENHHEV